MKLKFFILLMVLIYFTHLSIAQNNSNLGQNQINQNIPIFKNGEVNFKIKENYNIIIDYKNPPFEFVNLINKYKIKSIQHLFKSNDSVLSCIYKLNYDISDKISEKPDSLLLKNLITDLKKISYIEYVEEVLIGSTFLNPNDPYYNNSGNITPLSVIHAQQAWDLIIAPNSHYSPKIAIIDVGFEVTHEDLIDNKWVNTLEFSGTTGIDNDGNGFIDDINGWDFGNTDNSIAPTNDNHGTLVAGISAARTNNSKGIASIGDCGSTYHPQIMYIKIFADSLTYFDVNALAEGIAYATDNGADVINMSLGGNYPVLPLSGGGTFLTLQDALNYAYDNNVICVAASGNDGRLSPTWPCNLDHVICVGATDNIDMAATFTNFGDQIDVMAPGQEILSCDTASSTHYTTASGTSMSSPIVAGLCALALNRFPFLPINAIESCIESSCDNIDSVNQYPFNYLHYNPNNDPHNLYQYNLGHGRINALQTINCLISKSGTIGILPDNPCPQEPVNIFYYNNEEITSYTWTISPNIINNSEIHKISPKVVFGSIGSYDITLDAITISGTNIHYTETINISTLPTANISSINNLSNTCDGSSQSIFVQFTGSLPFSITLTDGSQNFVFSNIDQYQATIYVNVNKAYPVISVVSASDKYCTNYNTGNNISFNLINCCQNLIKNGDFESPIPTTSSNQPTSTSTGSVNFYTDYIYNNNGGINHVRVGGNYSSIGQICITQNGDQMLIVDGYCSTHSDAPPNGVNSAIWRSQIIQVTPNQDYYFSFWVNDSWNYFTFTENNVHFAASFKLFINNIQMNYDNLLHPPTNIYYAPVQPERWMHLCGIWHSDTALTVQLEIKDTTDNGGNGNDFLIDNIELRKINTLSVSVSDNDSICIGDSTNLFALAQGGLPPYSYSWLPFTSLSSSNISNPSASPVVSTNYSVNVTDSNECIVTGHVLISVFTTPINPILTINFDTLFSSLTYGNQWYGDNGILTGETNNFYIPVVNGNYYVIVTNICGSDTSNTILFESVGINDFTNKNNDKVSVYPNPANSQLNIEYNNSTFINARFELFNLFGGKVKNINLPDLKNKITIDVKDLQQGLYLFVIYQNDLLFDCGKIVIQK